MVGKCHSADLVGTSPLLRLYPRRHAESRPSFGACSPDPGALQTARLHHRLSGCTTVTAPSKRADTRAEVTTSGSGPDATSAPPETRPPWVKPGGISSQ